MSIVLKTDPKQIPDFNECLNYGTHFTGKLMGEILHDLAAAHAMQMAIEEATKLSNLSGPESLINQHRPMELCHWINERAAANMARLMKETK